MKYLKIFAGLIISGVCLWYSLQGIRFDKVGEAFGSLNWWWIALTTFPFVFVIWIKIWRWQYLLHPDKVGLHRLYSSLMISYLWNTVLPARLGEVVRAYAVARTEKIGTVRVFSSILLEKILDVISMFVLLVLLLPFLKIDDALRTGAIIFGSLMITAFVVCLVMAWRRREAEIVIKFFLKPLPTKFGNKLFGFASEILDTIAILLNPRISLILWSQTLALWIVNVFIYTFVAYAVNLPMSFEIGLMVMIASNLGMAVPSTPGYIGTFEAVIIAVMPATLSAAYANRDLVFTYALMEHVVGFLPVVLLGAYYTWREGLSLGKVEKPADTAVPAELTPVAVAAEKK